MDEPDDWNDGSNWLENCDPDSGGGNRMCCPYCGRDQRQPHARPFRCSSCGRAIFPADRARPMSPDFPDGPLLALQTIRTTH